MSPEPTSTSDESSKRANYPFVPLFASTQTENVGLHTCKASAALHHLSHLGPTGALDVVSMTT